MVEDAKQLLTMMVHLLISGVDRAHWSPSYPWVFTHENPPSLLQRRMLHEFPEWENKRRI
jgi:hypothetical protein